MITDAFVGVAVAVRARFRVFVLASLGVGVLSILLPPLLLSIVRKPVDFFTFNPWLRRLPEYVASPEQTVSTKLEKLWNLALFWFSADSPHGGTEWGFAVDVRDLARIAVTSLLVGAYLALWRQRQAMTAGGPAPRALRARSRGGAGRAGGIAGALAGVVGLSTGPCSVVGCGAPVLPVIGLALTGMSSGTLKLLTGLSSIGTSVVLVVLIGATAYLAWKVGAEREGHRPSPRPGV